MTTEQARRTTRHACAVVTAALAVLLSACGGGDDAAPAPVVPPAAVAPAIVTPPAPATVTEGETATFSVTASGTAPLAYQWQRNGVNVAGATAATYALAATLADDSAQLRVVVSNSAGTTTSPAALLRVNARPRPPTLTAQPMSMTIAELNSVTLTVSVEGTAPFSYQWQRSADGVAWSDITGATSATYTTPPLSRADTGVRYRVIVGNAAGPAVTSDAAQITVNPDAAVLAAAGGTVSGDNDKIRVTVPPGTLLGPTRFRFTPLAALPPGPSLPADYELIPNTAYAIAHDGPGFAPDALVTLTFRAAVAAPAPALTKAQANGWVAGEGRVIRLTTTPNNGAVRTCGGPYAVYSADNNAGDLRTATLVMCQPAAGSGSGTTTVAAVSPTTAVLPAITTQPADSQASVGSSVTFSVQATGSGLSYQWLRNGTAINGAEQSSTTFTVAAGDDGARFSVIVRNRFGSTTSRAALLTAVAPQPSAWGANVPRTAYSPNIGVPVALAPAGLGGAVYNDGGTLRALDLGTLGVLATGVVGTPLVVAGPNVGVAAVLFEQTTTQACNRIMAVGVVLASPENRTYVASAPFPVYESASACPSALMGAMSAVALPSGSLTGQVNFGLTSFDQGNATVQIVTGRFWFVPPFDGTTLTPTAVTTQVLPRSSECSAGGGGVVTNDRSMAGVGDGFFPTVLTTTGAVLGFTSGDGAGGSRTCISAMAINGTWSTAQPLWADGTLPPGVFPTVVTAMDGAGNALLAASRGASGGGLEMAVAYRPDAGNGPVAGWRIDTPLTGTLVTRPDVGFDTNGVATLLWRSARSGGGDAVYAATRSTGGTWSAREPISTAGQSTLFPRLFLNLAGDAVALFQQQGAAFTVWEATRRGGTWKEAVGVQAINGSARGSGQTAVRFDSGRNVAPLTAYWRETDPTASTQFRIVSATKQQ